MSVRQVLEGRARFYVAHAEAVEFAVKIPDESIEAVIMDPPYCSGGYSEASKRSAKGQGLRSGTIREKGWFISDAMGSAGLVWLLRAIAVQVARILKPGGSLVTFCDWRMASQIAPALESVGVRHVASPIWDKGNAGLGVGFRHQYEQLLHFTKGTGQYHRADISDVLRYKRVPTEQRENQTEKPVELLRDLVTLTTPRGGVVADFFTGSGSCGDACMGSGRRFIGCELSARSANRARQRLGALLRHSTGKAERDGQLGLLEPTAGGGDASELPTDTDDPPPRAISAKEYLEMTAPGVRDLAALLPGAPLLPGHPSRFGVVIG